jgi:hypothetical protein
VAQHKVTFTIPERSLGKADLEFKVKRNGEMVGRLRVSNGTVVWVPKNAQYGYKLGWVKFDELMQQHAQHEKG